jgi:hypothetical protein
MLPKKFISHVTIPYPTFAMSYQPLILFCFSMYVFTYYWGRILTYIFVFHLSHFPHTNLHLSLRSQSSTICFPWLLFNLLLFFNTHKFSWCFLFWLWCPKPCVHHFVLKISLKWHPIYCLSFSLLFFTLNLHVSLKSQKLGPKLKNISQC